MQQYTRTGARRAGDDYQDIIALEVLVEMLEHPDRYQWVKVEADDFGYLDDVVALRNDGSYIIKQVKFSTHPEAVGDPWTWESLLESRKGKNENELPSLLRKWSESLKDLVESGKTIEASIVTNRKASPNIRRVLNVQGLVDFKIIEAKVRKRINEQVGPEPWPERFFGLFHFDLDKSGLDIYEEAVNRRFKNLGGTEEGWLNLKNSLSKWIVNLDKLAPDGQITLEIVKKAALWNELKSLPEEFEVPEDFVVPSEAFHQSFLDRLLTTDKGCVVLSGSPGLGKSTYLSYLFNELSTKQIPIIRHHFYLPKPDRTVGRLEASKIQKSIMHDIKKKFPEALGEIANRNPNPDELSHWLEVCGKSFSAKKDKLILLIDGLDHVWREKKNVEELTKLFEHVLPVPEGVLVVVGTQPVPDDQLPERLLNNCPRHDWVELPLLELAAVKEWLTINESFLKLSDNQTYKDNRLNSLAESFFKKTKGHPLHLKYTLRALIERRIEINENNIQFLPGGPHENINNYYEDLWRSIPTGGKHILHLFASCDFPWTTQGLIECLKQEGMSVPDIGEAINHVLHLMTDNFLGYIPFHTSLLPFVQAHPEHKDHRERMQRLALDWLKKHAPDYWRWAFTWRLENELGNPEPLINKPDRNWVVDSIVKGRPWKVTVEILRKSAWIALGNANLPKFVRNGLLQGYLDSCRGFSPQAFEELLYPQLLVSKDEDFISVLWSYQQALTDREFALIAENLGTAGRVKPSDCFYAIKDRLQDDNESSHHSTKDDIKRSIDQLTMVAAISDDIESAEIVSLAERNRESGYALNILSSFAKSIKTYRKISKGRQLLGLVERLKDSDRPGIYRNIVCLAFEEDIDIYDLVKDRISGPDAFSAMYLVLCRNTPPSEIGELIFSPRRALTLKEYEVYQCRDEVIEAFHDIFFHLLANQLLNRGDLNSKFIETLQLRPWPYEFAEELNSITKDLAEAIRTSSAIRYGWLFGKLKDFAKPKWPEERDVYEFKSCAQLSIHSISFDLLRLLRKVFGTRPTIEKGDLEVMISFQNLWVWIDGFVNIRRPWITDEGIDWLLEICEKYISSMVQSFDERARMYVDMASIAAIQQKKEKAFLLIQKAAENLFAYGGHKDILLENALDIIEACHQSGIKAARTWLMQLSPAIAEVKNFTDGDGTRHLPARLAETLSRVSPDLLSGYYRWLCDMEEYDDALEAFHTFLRSADLSSEVNQAIARTAIDDQSVSILIDRQRRGDEAAEQALASLVEIMGYKVLEIPGAVVRHTTQDSGTIPHEKKYPEPEKIPPEQLKEYLLSSEIGGSYDIEEFVSSWIDYWVKDKGKAEVYRVMKELDTTDKWFGGYEKIFKLALELAGRDEAYEWLVKAQVWRRAWNEYWGLAEAMPIWDAVKQTYPERYIDFIQKTQNTNYWLPLEELYVYEKIVRLVKYLLFMGRLDEAEEIGAEVISICLGLVDPLKLQIPSWARPK